MKKPYKNPEVGDEVEITLGKKKEVGRLLESHDPGIILLKLKSGYNIGLKKEDITEINTIKREKKEVKSKNLKLSGKKPIIDFIITGGTISSKLDPKTGGVKDLTDPKEFFSTYPEIFELADIRVTSPFMKWSENMEFSDWAKLAKIVGKSLNDNQVKGVIISHGTDFLHYTGAALSFMLEDINKPVVLTYSQRSSDRGSSDSRLNLICSARAALSDISEVMLVGHANMDDHYCYALKGNKVRKMHSSRRDTFRPINCKPLAKVFPDGKIEKLSNYKKRGKGKVTVNNFYDDNVALVKFYPGQDPKILDFYLKEKYKGIVVEASGLGHVITSGNKNWIPKLKSVIEKGMFVYAAPQTIYGRLDPYVYESGRRIQEAGVVYLGDILPETAFVKLGWVLGKKEWRGSVSTKMKMLENVNGEFNNRLSTEFLE